MKNPAFVNDKIYHIYNRGVEKRDVFMDKQDYLRFIHCLFELNDDAPVRNVDYYFPKNIEIGSQYLEEERKPRKLLVEISIFTLMSNHFHLLLTQKKENGIPKFMQKLGIGYTMYFNQKYERVGGLFQGKFKAVTIEEQAHFLHIPHYIHTNPLSLASPNYGDRISILEDYRWSSFPDYIGKKNFPSVTQRDFLLDFYGGSKKYKEETKDWLKNRPKNLEKIKEVALD